MQTQTTSAGGSRTAPHLAVAIFIALAIIFGLHFAGFHFVVGVGAAR